jgi:hypothetical protein
MLGMAKQDAMRVVFCCGKTGGAFYPGGTYVVDMHKKYQLWWVQADKWAVEWRVLLGRAPV